MLSLDKHYQADVIIAFNNTSGYLDAIFNIDTTFFDNMVLIINSKELNLNKANTSNTSAAFLDLDLLIDNGVSSSKNYDRRYEFDTIVKYLF